MAFSIKSCPVTLCWNNENLLFYSNFMNYLFSLIKTLCSNIFVLFVNTLLTKFEPTEFWIFLCALVLKCWNLCIRLCIECNRGRGFALSSEIHQDILSPRPPSLSYHISTSFSIPIDGRIQLVDIKIMLRINNCSLAMLSTDRVA